MNSEVDFLKSLSQKEHKPLSTSLFHAMKPEYALAALERGYLEPRTSHRFWLDGKRRKDDAPDYESSSWMKGFSFTRSKEYAEKWGLVVLEFDRDKLKQHFKTFLISWNFLISQSKNINKKKETEEFIYCGGVIPSIPELQEIDRIRDEKIDQLYDAIYLMGKDLTPDQADMVKDMKLSLEKLENEPNWHKKFTDMPLGRNIDLFKYCKRIYIPEKELDFVRKIYPELEKHPNFKRINENNPETKTVIKKKNGLKI
jgi:hypothetical protein